MSPDLPAGSDDAEAEPAAYMQTSVRLLAATVAAAGLLLALTLVLMWATGVVWHVEQRPRAPATGVFVAVTGSGTGLWDGPNALTAILLPAVALAATSLAGVGALRRRPRLVRLSNAPAAVAFAATWALIVSAYFWGGTRTRIDAGDHPIRLVIRPRPRIEAAWPAALCFSSVALAAAIAEWWIIRRQCRALPGGRRPQHEDLRQ
ncbi:hypothetical protein [Actinoallomurus acaciae]|uniref:Uncharacterized protein n=1 Tax=Actinoallomurus acaciae TaxID=502577 RepID=A0ABV5YDN3_9ACTN